MMLTPHEFLAPLPATGADQGFPFIRHFGWLAKRARLEEWSALVNDFRISQV